MSETTRALVVDDDASVRYLVETRLKQLGHQVVSAPNAIAAADQVKSNKFDLILLDIMMPGKSGVDFLPEVLAASPDTAVVMMTSVTDVSVAVKAMRDGAYDYISKPFDIETLDIRVKRALERRALILRERSYRKMLEEMVDDLTRQLEQRSRELEAVNRFAQTGLSQMVETGDATRFFVEALSASSHALERLIAQVSATAGGASTQALVPTSPPGVQPVRHATNR